MPLQLRDKSDFIPKLTPIASVFKSNLFNTYSLSLQSIEVFVQIQTLDHLFPKLKSLMAGQNQAAQVNFIPSKRFGIILFDFYLRFLPFEFSFETGCHDARSMEIFNVFIHPCALPAEFCGERLNHSTYEYYQPNMMARQLGCGQMPPRLFLHEFLKPREEIKESIQARRVFEYECSPTLYTWPFTPTTIAYPLFIS
jgi:hypothetical protein